MKTGIVQGRLLPPVGGHIQEFPDKWKTEFDLIRQIGLNHVEWIVTKKSFSTNPIFNDECSSYEINSICADNLVDSNFIFREFLDSNLDPICSAAMKQGVSFVSIPLLEESDITDKIKRKKFIKLITQYADKYPSLNFSFEAETHWDNVLELISQRDNFWITYDTGNITSQKLDHQEYIANVHSRINNVHIKDRTLSGQTVEPLTGDTDFEAVFNALIKFEYNGVYTLQTARGLKGFEIQTIKEHRNIFERIYNEANS